jgi:hypothetical protein
MFLSIRNVCAPDINLLTATSSKENKRFYALSLMAQTTNFNGPGDFDKVTSLRSETISHFYNNSNVIENRRT